jgi:ParB family chromosome partitioning protein
MADTLSMGQARPLLQITDKELQLEMAARIADQGLSARQVEAWVRSVLEKKAQPPKEKDKPDAHLEALADRMKMHLGTAVSIRLAQGKKSSGRIEISFTSEAEFERLMALLTEEENDTATSEKLPPFSL